MSKVHRSSQLNTGFDPDSTLITKGGVKGEDIIAFIEPYRLAKYLKTAYSLREETLTKQTSETYCVTKSSLTGMQMTVCKINKDEAHPQLSPASDLCGLKMTIKVTTHDH